MRAQEALQATTATTGTVAFSGPIQGGQYGVLGIGTTLTQANIEMLAADNATWVPAITPTISSNKGYGTGFLPAGASLRANVSGTTTITQLIRIPGE